MIKFGPSGNSDSFYKEGYDHTEQAAKYVKERGLDCFEYSFGRGVRMSEEKACSIRAAFEKEGVEFPFTRRISSISPTRRTRWRRNRTNTCCKAAEWRS